MTPTSTEVQIHEFSTGIRPERTADGGWVSLGFTGQYMNATIDPIPYAVQRSIANKEFAVAEGASSDEPAIIGRVVSGGEESDWSVVAVVTRGRDEKGRSASVYRYFLAEGADSLCEIVAWIEEQQQNGQMPVFDPFETKMVGQPNISTVSAPDFKPLSDEVESWLFSESAPIIIQPEQPYTAQIIDKLASEKADTNRQPVAWAFKVEALEQPGRFQIIQAASDRAYEVLQRVKVSMTELTGPFVDEQAIKAAIKGLISSSRVKPEYVQALNEALGNSQITEAYWKEIFDGQGATNALKQGIYSPQMMRLLTLRAIVIPQTLPNYLLWLEKGNKKNDAAEFQSQFRNSLSQIPATELNIEFKITEGIRLLLPRLLKQKVSVENVRWLLKSTNGPWAKFYDQVIQEIEHDLQLMSQFSKPAKDLPFKLADNTWQSIWEDVKKYWQISSYSPKKEYQPFAEIFIQLCSYNFAAIFYHISFGKVPKEIFSQIHSAGWYCNVYGVRVERELTLSERFQITIEELWSNIVPVPLVIFATVISLLVGLAGGKFLLAEKPNSQQNTKNKTLARNPKIQPQISNSSIFIQSNKEIQLQTIPQDKKKSAIENFDKTQKAIKQLERKLVTALDQKNSKPQNVHVKRVKDTIIKVLGDPELNYEVIEKGLTNQEQFHSEVEKWVNAIYSYQKYRKPQSDGYINPGDDTANDLEKRVKEEQQQ